MLGFHVADRDQGERCTHTGLGSLASRSQAPGEEAFFLCATCSPPGPVQTAAHVPPGSCGLPRVWAEFTHQWPLELLSVLSSVCPFSALAGVCVQSGLVGVSGMCNRQPSVTAKHCPPRDLRLLSLPNPHGPGCSFALFCR